MPNAFDIGRYATNRSPLLGGTFVNVGDVMNSFGDVFSEVIDLLPKLAEFLERISEQDIFKLLEMGLETFIDLVFPPDGSVSPLITGLVNVLTNVATSGSIWTQMINLAITLGPQVFIGMNNVINGGTAADLLGAAITLFATVLTSNTALLQGFSTVAPVLSQLIQAGGGTGTTLADFGSLFTALASIAVTGITGLASGVLPWLQGAGALPSTASLGASQLSGLATGLATWLTSGGALPAGATAGLSQLTGLATGIATWLASGGALPGTTTLGAGGLTGLATGIGSWLTGGGALPSGATVAAGQLVGLATGIGSWLTGGGALPSGATVAAGQLVGLATGIGSWLTGGGALPGGVTLPGSQLTGSVASALLSGPISAALLPTITAAMTTGLTPIDTLAQAWGGTAGTTAAQLQTLAAAINPAYVTGSLGGGTIAQTAQNIVDGWSQALQNNNTLVNTSIAQAHSWLGDALQFLGWNPAGATPPSSVAAIASNVDQNLQQRAVQKDSFANIDPTIDATFPFSDVYTQSTLPTINVTATNPVSAPITCRDGGVKQSIRFKGYVSSGSFTGFYVNLYWVNPLTGGWTWFYTTPNYSGLLATGSTPKWNSINLAAASYINPNQGDVIQAEITVIGSGTYTMVGKTLSPQLLPMDGVYPSMPAAQRVNSTTPPSYYTIGSLGNSGGSGTSSTVTSTITVGPNDNCIFVSSGVYGYQCNAFSSVALNGVGVAMSAWNVANYYNSGGVRGYTGGGYIFITPPGVPTVMTISVTGIASSGGSIYIGVMTSSYSGVTGGTYVSGAAGGAGAANLAVNATTGQLLIRSLASEGAFTGSNFRYNGGGRAAIQEIIGVGGLTTLSANAAAQWAETAYILNGSFLPAPAAVPNPGAPGSTDRLVAYARAQPWIGLAGGAGVTSYSPVTRTFTGGGNGQLINPTALFPWANYFDVIVFPDGGAGANGNNLSGGLGGHANSPIAQTLTAAQAGASNWTMNIGTGGAMSTQASGQGVSVVIPGYGTISRTGGGGETAGWGSQGGAPGDSCPGITVTDHYGNQQYYPGGAGGSGGQGSGQAPGGAGGGGNVTWMNSYLYGGQGGAAQVIIRAYQ